MPKATVPAAIDAAAIFRELLSEDPNATIIIGYSELKQFNLDQALAGVLRGNELLRRLGLADLIPPDSDERLRALLAKVREQSRR